MQLTHQGQGGFIEEAQITIQDKVILCNIMLSSFKHEQQDCILLELQTSEHHVNIRKDMKLQQQSRVSNHLVSNLAHEIKKPFFEGH